MSVIITGMDMPTGCHECQKFLDEDDYCIIQDLAMTQYEWDRYTFDKQYKNCPLKSIDGLIKKIVNSPIDVGQDMYKTKYDGAARRQNEIIEIIKEYCEVSE